MNTLPETQPGGPPADFKESTVGRFEVLERLGAGGMGDVFLAKDPQLDRQVALKLLRQSAGEPGATERLLREARAMAKVSHPNVVSVFDAGLAGNQPWVAMELIRGSTLREWLAVKRPWPETLRLLCEVGKGLRAAHEAGLVHRDLKPENVLVGDNGRVAVTDFGIAHSGRAEPLPELATPASHRQLEERITHGVLMGTPGYMAPEQYLRQATDARTDQFAFALTCYEALYGQLPFEMTPGDLAASGMRVVHGAPRAPGPTKVPPRVWRALERALQPKQEDRFPSMAPLLEELEAALPGKRSVAPLVVVGAMVALGLVSAFFALRPAPCDGGVQLLGPVWNAQRRERVQAALSQAPLGAVAAPQVLAVLDRFASQWSANHLDACQATREGRQSPAALDLRMSCLSRRLGDFDALLGALEENGAKLAQTAEQAAVALGSTGECGDAAALGARLPVPPEDQAKVAALDHGLSRLRAQEDLGQWRDALEPAKTQAAEARKVGYPPALAEALVELARTENLSGHPQESEQTFEEAVNTAEVARDDRVRARALLLWAQELLGQHRLDEASKRLKAAGAVVERVADAKLQRQHKGLEADLATAQGRLDDAAKLAKEALTITEAQHPVDERELVGALGTYAFSLVRAEKLEEAVAQYRRAIPLAEHALGPDNPGLAKLLGECASALAKLRKLDEARPLHARAHAIIARALGEESEMSGTDYSDWGMVLIPNRKLDEAKEALEQALKIRQKVLPLGSPLLASTLNGLGVLAAEDARYADAADYFKRALAIREPALGPTHPRVLADLNNIAGAYSMAGKHAEALAVFDDLLAREAKEKSARMSDDGHAQVVMGRAEELYALGRYPEARQTLQQSHELALKSEAPDLPARQLLIEAEVAWDGFGEKAPALALVKQARPLAEKVGDPYMTKTLDEIAARATKGQREKH